MSDQRDAGKCSAVELVTVTLPPPPGRRIPCHNCNTGEGCVPWGGALEARALGGTLESRTLGGTLDRSGLCSGLREHLEQSGFSETRNGTPGRD